MKLNNNDNHWISIGIPVGMLFGIVIKNLPLGMLIGTGFFGGLSLLNKKQK